MLLIGWWFCEDLTTGADNRGDFIKYRLFIALKGSIYMADHQMSFISVLNVPYHTYITFQVFGKAHRNARPTGADKGVFTGLNQLCNYRM